MKNAEKKNELQVKVEVIDREAVINGCHHRKGKLLTLPASAAEFLERRGAVKILGT